MSEYYNHTTYPQSGSAGSAAAMRAELEAIEAGTDKLPVLAGNANKLVKVNASSTALQVSAVISEDGTNATITGDLFITGGDIGQNSAQKHVIPLVASDTLALLAATQTITNKTVNLLNNTLTGTLAQFNTALSGADFASLAGTETLTAKTLNLLSNTLTGTLAQFNAALSDADFVSLVGAETLTNKTITAALNTITTAASGNLIATTLNAALAELQTDIDTRLTVVPDGSVTTAKLSTGAPTWTTAGELTVVQPALLGYGTGAGGAVTQLTSKTTAVTLNKPIGQITTSNTSLAAGAEAIFTVNNSLVTANDVIIINGNLSTNYTYRSGVAAAGAFPIFIKNTTAGALAEVLTVNFGIIKGAIT